jgi:hypothetical protein
MKSIGQHTTGTEWGPPGCDADIWERPPPMSKTSMAGPWEVMLGIQERPPPMSKTSMVSPLGAPGGPVSVHDLKECCDLHELHR